MPEHSPAGEWPKDYGTIMQIGRGLADSSYVPVQEMIYSVNDRIKYGVPESGQDVDYFRRRSIARPPNASSDSVAGSGVSKAE